MAQNTSNTPQDDGLPCAEVGAWAEDKYKLVSLYDSLFSTGMKNKWGARVYIDLFAGPGLARVKGTDRLLWGSPLLALQVKDPFDKYIFCESDPVSMDALRQRALGTSPRADISYVVGNCNDHVEDICQRIPTSTRDFGVLSFCFVDPYDLSIRFSTIQEIARRTRADFLILLALYMDAARNEANYTNPNNRKLDDFLGQSHWRARWPQRGTNATFPQFLAEEYAGQMSTLGYLRVPFYKMRQVRDDGNHPLYRLALFSRSPLAYKYWNAVLKYGTSQTGFWG